MLQITACVVHCPDPTIGMNVIVDGYDTSGGLEGSQIWYHCETGFVPRDRMIATCSCNGSWMPDPTTLRCKGNTIMFYLYYIPNLNVLIYVLYLYWVLILRLYLLVLYNIYIAILCE